MNSGDEEEPSATGAWGAKRSEEKMRGRDAESGGYILRAWEMPCS